MAKRRYLNKSDSRWQYQTQINEAIGQVVKDEARHAVFINRQSAFQSARPSKLSARTLSRAEALKKAMITYTERYGTEEQAEFWRRASSAKIRWMYNEGILMVEEFIEYEGVTWQGGRLMDSDFASNKIQSYIDAYNYLNQRVGK